MINKHLFFSVQIVLACIPGMVLAESMRCGNDLVRPGDSTERLLELCGEPVKKEVKTGRHDYWAEYWTYRDSPLGFGTVVKIEYNKITSMEREE